jgi:ComF family protein
MASIADALIATVFAPVCLSCARVLEAPTRSPVCDACWGRIGRFATPACDLGPLSSMALSRVRAVGPFDAVLRDVVHGLKFQGRRTLAARLGPLLREAGGDLLADADAVVPVPLHPWRQWRRTYNQADLLAATLGRPVWRVIRRRLATPPQTALDRDARQDNVRQAFVVNGWLPGAAARARRRIDGSTLVLVDDVLTTGATLDACARVLLDAGAQEVRAIAVARALLNR